MEVTLYAAQCYTLVGSREGGGRMGKGGGKMGKSWEVLYYVWFFLVDDFLLFLSICAYTTPLVRIFSIERVGCRYGAVSLL